jgi:hypothetical protein
LNDPGTNRTKLSTEANFTIKADSKKAIHVFVYNRDEVVLERHEFGDTLSQV